GLTGDENLEVVAIDGRQRPIPSGKDIIVGDATYDAAERRKTGERIGHDDVGDVEVNVVGHVARLHFAVVGGIGHPSDVANGAVADLSTTTGTGADFTVNVIVAEVDDVRIF